jgi:TPP-dependent pyruvate/acetoin dehydrogenase alpha subunit
MDNRLPDAQRRLMVERMIEMRRFDEAVMDLEEKYGSFGRAVTSIGNEGPVTALSLLTRPVDRLLSTHRNHGHIIAMGADPMRSFAEILGRKDGLSGGKAGTLHLCDPSRGFLSTSAMVGGANALAVGAGFAQKKKGNGGIAVSLLGDGTLDEGITYECLNLACLLELPVLFLCENNATPRERPSSMLMAEALTDVPKALTIPTLSCNGTDPEAVYDALSQAIPVVRRGGPFFVECKVKRWPGMRNQTFRQQLRRTDLAMAWDRSLVQGPHAEWLAEGDPLLLKVGRLVGEGVMSQEEVLAADKDITARMKAEREKGEASPWPAPEAALENVFG